MKQKLLLASSILLALPSMADVANNGVSYPVPADKFDMRNWKITIPSDINQDGRVDEIEGVAMMSYSHSDFFFLDKDGNMVFEVHNKAITTKNSKNARSELRQMARGADFSIDTHDNLNNWAFLATRTRKPSVLSAALLKLPSRLTMYHCMRNTQKNTRLTL